MTAIKHTHIYKLLELLKFSPAENVQNVFIKKYDNAKIEIDFAQQKILYDQKIRKESETTSNFSKPENFVVLECVDRLLTTGYKAENIILEKTWQLGHNKKGQLDILVTKTENEEEKAYLMIECKTLGKEYEKALEQMQKDGGQLFSYFQQDKSTELLMLYASSVNDSEIEYQNEIVKIEEDYRASYSISDFFIKWNKITKNNGVWENPPYNFHPKVLKEGSLKAITEQESKYIFNRFLEILRHNVVSDKPNAFNKIFNLFLCKIYDEKMKQGTGEELDFQWKEGIDGDDYIDFMIRLTDLYKNGMDEFLDKEVTDITDQQLEKELQTLFPDFFHKISYREKEAFKKNVIHKLRLEKNNEFAIKEVFDAESSRENAKVVREIVELLQRYKLRYAKKQQYLSDFFELLLTTGLKQEAGQFFTPLPIAQFIIRSLPLNEMIEDKLNQQKNNDYLPYIIDYAAGSGHFIAESMHEIQKYINRIDTDKLQLNTATKKFIKQAQENHFDWAFQYVYGIEKDYRLVKVSKVGCYLHGDGLANVIHSDGLANFKHKDYKGKLQHTDKYAQKDNRQFDIVVSNPPYSISSFKNVTRDYYSEKDFELYGFLTEQSSEIEALFIERTKQLLKDDGVAGVILPSSILSNTGVYTKTREIILQFFEIIAIAEFGNNTFMATGTNTIVIFLRRRENEIVSRLQFAIERIFTNMQDVTLNGIENPIAKYIAHVWENINLEDYISILQKTPNKNAQNHELFKEYRKSFFQIPKKDTPENRKKAERDFWDKTLKTEQEKILYFVLTYKQKVVLINSGQKNVEKQFLGYEFSFRRGSEGIHPIQKGKIQDRDKNGNKFEREKRIEDCTKLFDEESFTNPEKASTYVYQAFLGEYPQVHESLKNHISHARLVDMLTFDRVEFDKLVSTSVKKKVVFEEIWNTHNLVKLGEIANIQKGTSITKQKIQDGDIPVIAGGKTPAYFHNVANRNGNVITVSASGAAGFVNYFANPIFASDCNTIISKDEKLISTKLIYAFLKIMQEEIYSLQKGIGVPHVYAKDLEQIKIPLPPLDIQQKIVADIEILEEQEEKAKNEVEKLKAEIGEVMRENVETGGWEIVRISDIATIVRGASPRPIKAFITYEDDGVNWIKIGDVKPESKFITTTKEKITIDGAKKSRFVQTGDFIISNSMSVGRPYIVNITGCIHDGWLLLSNFSQKIDRDFFYYLLMSEECQNNFKNVAHGGTSVDNLNIDRVSNIKIPLPPLDIQQQIVAQIEMLEEKIALLENELKEMPQKKEEVLQKYL